MDLAKLERVQLVMGMGEVGVDVGSVGELKVFAPTVKALAKYEFHRWFPELPGCLGVLLGEPRREVRRSALLRVCRSRAENRDC